MLNNVNNQNKFVKSFLKNILFLGKGKKKHLRIYAKSSLNGNALEYLDSPPILNYTLKRGYSMELDKESLVDLICKHCDFYKESEKDLECGAYKILKKLLEKGMITPEDMANALRE